MPYVEPRVNPKNKNVEPFDRMLRRFKKACEKKGIVQECRDRKYHVKANDLRNQRNQDLKRKKKLDKKRAEQANYKNIRIR
jgi:ribosomal protein S21